MSVIALFSTLITSPEETEFEIDVATASEAESLRVNLVKRLSSYREQLAAVLPSDQLPKSLRFSFNKDTGTAIVSIGPKKQNLRAVTFRIINVPTINPSISETSSDEQDPTAAA